MDISKIALLIIAYSCFIGFFLQLGIELVKTIFEHLRSKKVVEIEVINKPVSELIADDYQRLNRAFEYLFESWNLKQIDNHSDITEYEDKNTQVAWRTFLDNNGYQGVIK